MLCRNLHKEGAIGAPSGHYSDAEIADTKVKAEVLAADVEAEGTVLVRNNDNTLPLAFVVVVEHGGSGSDVAGSVAAQLLEQAQS